MMKLNLLLVFFYLLSLTRISLRSSYEAVSSISMKYKILGEKLRQWRLQASLTQKNVSDELGYEVSQFISNWERGLAYPPIKDIFVLASLYRVTAESIFKILLTDVIEETRSSLKKEFQESTEKYS